ncbi:50S ribosomal protein L1 [Candidatus Saccharibacteria bacterium]|nr:MAG: 50S ribosomal protein L1 [Candidatus Saccharibacteria bacterium]
MKLDVSDKNTIVEINAAIKAAKEAKENENKDIIEHREANVAKAGKRSEKALKEAEEKAEKEERKASHDTTPQDPDAEATKKKGPVPITRPRLERRGKKYQEVAKNIDKTKLYSLKEAVELAEKSNTAKFDASLEVHVRLGVDPRQADQNIRAMVALPHGTGKTVRVAVFAPEEEHAKAKKAGADVVGDEDLLKQLEKGEINFDTLIATPQYMPKLGKYARVLGPKGLMPNPKSGTVSADVEKAVQEAKAGKVEYRVDKQAIVHLSIGKVSFGSQKLLENAQSFFASLHSQKPTSLKGNYIHSVTLTTTMGPGIKVDQNSL